MSLHDDEKMAAQHEAVFSEKAGIADYKQDAIEAENAEHDMTVMQAVKEYPMATFWAFIMSCTIIMESYDVFLVSRSTLLTTITIQTLTSSTSRLVTSLGFLALNTTSECAIPPPEIPA
jgi:hypothetical protein